MQFINLSPDVVVEKSASEHTISELFVLPAPSMVHWEEHGESGDTWKALDVVDNNRMRPSTARKVLGSVWTSILTEQTLDGLGEGGREGREQTKKRDSLIIWTP